jgi:two-component system sensor histidine kinase BaeS
VELSYAQPGKEIPFYGDEGLLRRMILNLLDNALKHTAAGGHIRVGITQRDGTCAIRISDTGAGIPTAAQPHIFERFYRADKARAPTEIMAAEQDWDSPLPCGSQKCTTVEFS